MKICIIEDEIAIAQPLKQLLEQNGFAVDMAHTGTDGLRFLETQQYDCVLLDIHLPEISGMEIIEMIRKKEIVTPVILLTARSQIYDKIKGFEQGADDYVTKPFHMDELIARIRAVIKRSSENKSNQLRFGPYLFFPEKNSIQYTKGKTEHTIELTTKETAILEYLLRSPQRIISTEEILEHVWDREVNVFTDTVKTHMKTLRQKIDPKKEYITTVRGKGYMMKEI